MSSPLDGRMTEGTWQGKRDEGERYVPKEGYKSETAIEGATHEETSVWTGEFRRVSWRL